jgi:uncharacterized protein YheU (UPF0270 family)
VDVPHTRLAADVLLRVLEEFVTRDGTDYGATEKTLEQKVRDVQRRLERGEAVIVYDDESHSINIVAKDALPRDARDAASASSEQPARSRAPLAPSKDRG